MNDLEIKREARRVVCEWFAPVIDERAGEQYEDADWAIPVTIDGKEIWVGLNFKVKNFKDSGKRKAFDPFVAAEEWQARLAEDAEKKALREEKKAKKAE